jgi:cyclopropane fatty-acyl-phospholipid synthase-like methyltransferase
MIDKNKYELLENGTYKSTAWSNPVDIYNDDYWDGQKHSTIEGQVPNVTGKNELVKAQITDIEPKTILEIACAPGILMGDLGIEYKTVGIEVDERYKAEIQKLAPRTELMFGFFPEVTKDLKAKSFSNIIALDVIEHVLDGDAFLKECNRLLVKNGVLVIQAPIMLEDGIMDDKAFHYIEHIWIYSIQHITELLKANGFKVTNIDRWKPMHEQITAKKIK